MTSPVTSLLRATTKLCFLFIGGDRSRSSRRLPEVIIHDPAAQGPQDLDDPFLDTKAQARVGQVIARAARRPESPK